MLLTLKTMLKKQKKGELECPHDRLVKALYALSFLNQDEAGQTARERQYSFDTKACPRPLVMVKDPVTGQWAEPVDLLTGGAVLLVSPQVTRWNGLSVVCVTICCIILIGESTASVLPPTLDGTNVWITLQMLLTLTLCACL